jgi:hypothetical protein
MREIIQRGFVMQKMKLNQLLFAGIVLLSAGNAFGAPLPPPPTSVGGALWPYVTTGVVLGVGAWKMWKK